MRVLVTGGAGYIGSVMVGVLEENSHEVLVLDDMSKGHQQAVGDARLARVDLEDRAAVREACVAFRPESCMHFAAQSLVGESMEKPLKYFNSNLTGSLNLLSGLVEAGCPSMVFSSSAAVYGAPDSVPITEDAATSPINPYGISKLAFEQVLAHVARVGEISFASLRYFNAAGADLDHGLGEDHRPESHIIPNVIYAALGREDHVAVFGEDYPTPDGTCIRDYIHIRDLCQAHLLALEHLSSGGGGGIFNLGNGNGFSVREVIDSVRRISGTDFKVTVEGRRPGDPPELVASSEKIRSVLGWKPVFADIDAIVGTAWKWHSENPEGYSS